MLSDALPDIHADVVGYCEVATQTVMTDCCVRLCHDQKYTPCSQVVSIEKPSLAACLLMLPNSRGP